MAVALLALFVALGGSSYAALEIRIGSAQIIDNSVRSRDIRNDDVQGVDIRDNEINSDDVSDGSLRAADFAPGELPAPAASAAFSAFKSAFTLRTGASQVVPVARLDLPAGKYVVMAKLYTGIPLEGAGQVRCDLVAGADFDRAVVNHDIGIAFASLALNVVHDFASPGIVQLYCGHDVFAATTDLQAIRITAIRVENLTTVPSP
jgi:hypothetical protein